MAFKDNLKSELNYKDILVKELAATTGISRKTLDNYLNSREYMPPADVAVKIAQVLGVTVEYLVTGDDFSQYRSSFGTEIKELIQNFKNLSKYDRKIVISMMQLLKNREQGSW